MRRAFAWEERKRVRKTVSIGPGRKRAKTRFRVRQNHRLPHARAVLYAIFVFGFRRVCTLLATHWTHCPRIRVYYIDVWDFDNHTHDTWIHRKINMDARSTTCIVVGWRVVRRVGECAT